MIKSYFGLPVKSFKLLVLTITCLTLFSFTKNNVYANSFSDLLDDCATYNLDSSCNASPKIKAKAKPNPLPPAKKAPTRSNYIKDELLITYPKAKAAKIQAIAKKYRLTPGKRTLLSSINTGLLVAKTNGQNPLNLTKVINKKEKNIKASPNNIFKLASVSFKKAYSLSETGVSAVHRTTLGKGINICMVDTPVDIFHPSFSGSFIETLDLIDYSPNDLDIMAHGTSVAGVLVSQNKLIGVAPKSKLFAISAFSTSKYRPYVLQGTSSNIATAINRCILNKADVINLSFTGGKDRLIEKLIAKAVKQGIIVIAAGGNGGHWGSTVYPALIPGVLAATAVDDKKRLFSMADKGRFIDYAAPGVDILTTAPGGKYILATGTSLSSAHLSGIVALLLSEKRNQVIDNTLKKTAVDLGKPGRDQEYGDGLVSASRALAIIKKPQ